MDLNFVTLPQVDFKTTEVKEKKKLKRVVASCVLCKASKTACSHTLPCTRCVRLGRQSECKPAPRRARITKRKRQPKEFKEVQQPAALVQRKDSVIRAENRVLKLALSSAIPELNCYEQTFAELRSVLNSGTPNVESAFRAILDGTLRDLKLCRSGAQPPPLKRIRADFCLCAESSCTCMRQ